ncbi:DsbA family oxidoreductase [Yinghuangia soli]|uniref:DsbA family oxidoreductase n=1 Tax=Yinghuangia soli TaxID=2908204 RepID=A0AA41Q8Y8_9ACTN|nr:DsbA family oxidoreductase [Yinghuangia soli]MCF2533793.1 DsbA family oxidoreductase [Yinghuangia soli]
MLVEVFGDMMCPWCYIGKRRLEAAVAGLDPAGRAEVEVVWRSFELDPDSSRTPGPTAEELMPRWWGDRAAERIALIKANGVQEGLELNLHLSRPVNMFDAHRLVQLAAHQHMADAVLEALMYAYHTEGADLADREVLERLGVAAGLAQDGVRSTLHGDAYAAEVRADEARGAALGVTGVPSVVVGGRPPVSGIEPAERLRAAIRDALAERTGASVAAGA